MESESETANEGLKAPSEVGLVAETDGCDGRGRTDSSSRRSLSLSGGSMRLQAAAAVQVEVSFVAAPVPQKTEEVWA